MSWQVYRSDPVLPQKRLRVLMAAIILALLLLVARLWWLQIANGSLFEQLSAGARTRHIPLRAPRGRIYDRTGKLLATTRPQYMVVVSPLELRRYTAAERARIFGRAAGILNISVGEIEEILNRSRQAGFNTIKLKTGVGPAVITHLLEDAADLPGFDVERVPERSYPMGAVAAHVLGYVGDPSEADLKRVHDSSYNGADQIGKQGLERYYENALRGVDGERVIEVNAHGVPVSNQDVAHTNPVPGNQLVLTLDAHLQQVAQQAFPMGMHGAVVALDVRTGEILALASVPGFDPNVFLDDSPESRKRRAGFLLDLNGRPMLNRAAGSSYPPGSTFKLVTSTAGFAYRQIDPEDTIWCRGGMKIGRTQFKKCWAYHGTVNYMKAMAQSCDAYFYDLMKRLTSTELATISREFGLGRRTGIDLSAEAHGFIPTPAWKQRRFKDGRWWFGDSCNMAIGQGFIQATPLQMALVTAAVANGGRVLRPHLVAEVRSPDGRVLSRVNPQVTGVLAVPPDALGMVRKGMLAAVRKGGTAGIVRFKDMDVGGKTGSAQDLPNPHTHAWFVCFAPYENPKLAICVLVEHGGHGGTEAGPVARALLKTYFHLKDQGNGFEGRTD